MLFPALADFASANIVTFFELSAMIGVFFEINLTYAPH